MTLSGLLRTQLFTQRQHFAPTFLNKQHIISWYSWRIAWEILIRNAQSILVLSCIQLVLIAKRQNNEIFKIHLAFRLRCWKCKTFQEPRGRKSLKFRTTRRVISVGWKLKLVSKQFNLCWNYLKHLTAP